MFFTKKYGKGGLFSGILSGKLITFVQIILNNSMNNSFLGSMPPVVKNLLIINILCWFASITLPNIIGFDVVDWLGMHYWQSDKFVVTQLITYMFLHDTGSLFHLFFNMFALYMFGKNIEYIWGAKKFLLFYFVTGIGAALVQQLTWTLDYMPVANAFNDYLANRDITVLMPYLNVTETSIVPTSQVIQLKQMLLGQPITIGASGAVFGILLAFGMLFPDARLMMLFLPIPIKARYFVIFYALMELFLGVSNFQGDSIAHFAHLGGMVFGLILILFWRKKGTLYN